MAHRRNPLSRLKSVDKLRELPIESRRALRSVVEEVGAEARKRAAGMRRDNARDAREASRLLELSSYARLIARLLGKQSPGRPEQEVFNTVSLVAKTVEEIAAETRLSKEECYAALNRLIAAGKIERSGRAFAAAGVLIAA